MSAFLCSPEHIGQLASWIARSRHLGAAETARILARQNLASLAARYGHDPNDEDYVAECMNAAEKPCPDVPAVNIIKATQCLEYQSCETEDWKTTEAADLCRVIISAACHSLPGYNDAPWGAPTEQAHA